MMLFCGRLTCVEYSLLSFRPSEVPFVAAEMRGDQVILFLCGIFGWSGTPASFQVVTRALKWEIGLYLVCQICTSTICLEYHLVLWFIVTLRKCATCVRGVSSWNYDS